MADTIRINNYFFDNIVEYHPERKELGSTRRMPNGTIKTQYKGVNPYTFKLKLENVTPTQLGQLLSLDNLCKPIDDSTPENLSFTDDTDGIALDVIFPLTVTIPIDGFTFDRENGEGETYEVDLTLEEVV